uniref:Secreted protein n=1 Tax=Rhipicephalus appendiculatus TaxID=34631 RepID=A0A131YCX2_RHIAP
MLEVGALCVCMRLYFVLSCVCAAKKPTEVLLNLLKMCCQRVRIASRVNLEQESMFLMQATCAQTQTLIRNEEREKEGCAEDIFQRKRALRMSSSPAASTFSVVLFVSMPSLCTLSRFFGAATLP